MVVVMQLYRGQACVEGGRNIPVRSACGSCSVAASTRTVMAVPRWEGGTTMLLAAVRAKRSTPRACA